MSTYICIDLKTFFASVECVERGLDPFETNLVVADPSRGKGAICLAVSPKMKMLGVKNRCRIYEIPSNIKYITAIPRMKKYIEYSSNIFEIYLKYFSSNDIHIYSIDEAFIDVTTYLKYYNMDAVSLVKFVMKDVFDTYGITATAGIGTNMYLTKVALDIMSKHTPTNIGILDEEKYKKELWHHKPLTDFWQIGRGIEKRLNKMYLFDMYDVAHCEPKRLYNEFGINAELLIDHSWGREKCTIKDIKNYTPKSSSISNSQILFKDYNYEDAKLVMIEMIELLSLRLVENKKYATEIGLYIGYSKDIIQASGGTKKLSKPMNLYTSLSNEFTKLYEQTTNKNFPIRRIGITFGKLTIENEFEQISMFEDIKRKDKEEKLETTINYVKTKMGKNSILRGMNLQENATTLMRNKLIGGHNGE